MESNCHSRDFLADLLSLDILSTLLSVFLRINLRSLALLPSLIFLGLKHLMALAEFESSSSESVRKVVMFFLKREFLDFKLVLFGRSLRTFLFLMA